MFFRAPRVETLEMGTFSVSEPTVMAKVSTYEENGGCILASRTGDLDLDWRSARPTWARANVNPAS